MTTVISDCGRYRYVLTRQLRAELWRPNGVESVFDGTALFCMLNPSTADADVDDPTIRRCIGFAEKWGCMSLTVVNLYAFREPNPNEMRRVFARVGPENDRWLAKCAAEAGAVVCAWGQNAEPERAQAVVDLLRGAGATLLCLGTTKDGYPRHPLYVRADQPVQIWTPRAEGCKG